MSNRWEMWSLFIDIFQNPAPRSPARDAPCYHEALLYCSLVGPGSLDLWVLQRYIVYRVYSGWDEVHSCLLVLSAINTWNRETRFAWFFSINAVNLFMHWSLPWAVMFSRSSMGCSFSLQSQSPVQLWPTWHSSTADFLSIYCWLLRLGFLVCRFSILNSFVLFHSFFWLCFSLDLLAIYMKTACKTFIMDHVLQLCFPGCATSVSDSVNHVWRPFWAKRSL